MTAMQPADDDRCNPIKPKLINPRLRPSPKCYRRAASSTPEGSKAAGNFSILLLALIGSVGIVTVCVASS